MKQDTFITKLVEQAYREVSDTMGFANSGTGNDPAHDMGHFERVANLTIYLRDAERGKSQTPQLELKSVPEFTPEFSIEFPEFSDEEAWLAALFHDYVNPPKNSPERKQASALSAIKAKQWLAERNFSETKAKSICEAIEDHSFSSGRIPRNFLGQCLQDSDRLEALGALGIFRWIATGLRLGSALVSSDDPWALNRPLNDKQFMVDHCFEKLLLLPKFFQTNTGRKLAGERAKVIFSFLEQLGKELGNPLPPHHVLKEKYEINF